MYLKTVSTALLLRFHTTRRFGKVEFKSYTIKNSLNMAEHVTAGLLLPTVINALEEFAPKTLAESWDNVGLLVDPIEDFPIKDILLTNDLTETVVKEAIKLKAGLIISYHPNIFQGLKSVSGRTWKERIVVQCIKNNIAVYSPHTSWDSIKGGVNDWLAIPFNSSSTTPIKPDLADPNCGAGRLCVLNTPITIQDVIRRVKDHIGIPHLRLALATNKDESSLISSVALCAGSGNSVLNGFAADLYLTGEMLHHDVLDATQKGIHVILCNHSDSERGYLKMFQSILHDKLGQRAKVHISQTDKDPLKTV